jgi:hypothetical protein
MLVRDGTVTLLDVNGTVVGAFPFSEYEESRVTLRSGDLLVCYTDGVTEPENEFGEMFGEERLIELLLRNAQQPRHRVRFLFEVKRAEAVAFLGGHGGMALFLERGIHIGEALLFLFEAVSDFPHFGQGGGAGLFVLGIHGVDEFDGGFLSLGQGQLEESRPEGQAAHSLGTAFAANRGKQDRDVDITFNHAADLIFPDVLKPVEKVATMN